MYQDPCVKFIQQMVTSNLKAEFTVLANQGWQMAAPQNPTGYGPRRGLVFNGDENKYELWEVKFLAFMRIQKLYDVFVPSADERELDEARNETAFAELVQCLDDRSLSLIIREAGDYRRKSLTVLREYYQGKGKPRIIALYTELTLLKKDEN
jgi:hypothetical protein